MKNTAKQTDDAAAVAAPHLAIRKLFAVAASREYARVAVKGANYIPSVDLDLDEMDPREGGDY